MRQQEKKKIIPRLLALSIIMITYTVPCQLIRHTLPTLICGQMKGQLLGAVRPIAVQQHHRLQPPKNKSTPLSIRFNKNSIIQMKGGLIAGLLCYDALVLYRCPIH